MGVDWNELRAISLRDVLDEVMRDLAGGVEEMLTAEHDDKIDAQRDDIGRGWDLSISSARRGYSTRCHLTDLEVESTGKAAYRVLMTIADALRERVTP